ncbi:mandelate racemase/muconate lactonizing enzyme family protein [Pirellulales bacterium]|nr:mandelate racemase/muconate lactonizing enzyme family protein [Pirellulales bacterium]
MKITSLELKPVSIPYTHRESSTLVQRDGVTDVIVKITTDEGLVGWGESCSGANVESVTEALISFEPFLLGQNPWNRDALWYDCYHRMIWHFREQTFNFAWAGVDMALWDLCGKQCGRPLYDLLGGLRRKSVNYFYYLPTMYVPGIDLEMLEQECRRGLEQGYTVFYMKTGVDFPTEVKAVELIRKIIGPDRKIRIDCNEAWTLGEAVRKLTILDQWNLDFAEQPIPTEPMENVLELKRRTPVPLSGNEAMWRRADAWNVIHRRAYEVVCFSSYFVGTLGEFHRVCHAADAAGMLVCRHTHGELGLTAAAHHHVLLNLPRVVDGNQQTAHLMVDDILQEPLPIATGPDWGLIEGPGLGVEVDEEKVEKYHQQYLEHGQIMPYDLEKIRQQRAAGQA